LGVKNNVFDNLDDAIKYARNWLNMPGVKIELNEKFIYCECEDCYVEIIEVRG